MRRFVSVAFALVGFAGVATAQSPLKIGYINSQRILQEAPGRAEAEQQFEREVGSFRQQIQRMEDSLRTLGTAFERERPSLQGTALQQRTTALQTIEAQFQARADTLNAQMARRQQELVRPIMENINRVLVALRAEQGYSVIFDVAAQGQPIVAADTTLDLTTAVIARLRAAGPPTSSTNRPATQTQPAGVTRPRQ